MEYNSNSELATELGLVEPGPDCDADTNNDDMMEVYDSIQVKFENLNESELELSKAFLNFNNFFPEFSNPTETPYP